MKTLWLLRHAKSSWKDTTLSDHDRPLKKRGRKAAAAMGTLLNDLTPFPAVVLCSTAVRAKETWQIVADTIIRQRTIPHVEYRADLYHADPETLGEIVADVSDEFAAVLLIGHNPGLEEFAEDIAGTEIDIPTAALVKIEFSADSWTTAGTSGKGALAGIWRPQLRQR